MTSDDLVKFQIGNLRPPHQANGPTQEPQAVYPYHARAIVDGEMICQGEKDCQKSPSCRTENHDVPERDDIGDPLEEKDENRGRE